MTLAAQKLLKKLPALAKRQCFGTLREYIDEFEICPGERTLVQVNALINFLSDAGIVLVPSIIEGGDFDSVRTMVFASEATRFTSIEIRDLISKGEDNKTEFKSSFFTDRRKHQKVPGLPSKDYKSDEVLLSALKTIAAYMNSDGGTLLVGVMDDGDICGIELDHILPSSSNEDLWQLCVRSNIESQFKDGKTVNPYVTIEIETIQGKRVAIIRVLPKPSTVFLKSIADSYSLYVRNGNRTDKLDITHAEEFFRLKWERTKFGKE